MPVGRHRHAINVRADGLASVLGTLVRDRAVQVALLVDVDSGMVLDACGPGGSGAGVDQEQLGAAHGDLMRLALGPVFGTVPGAQPTAGDCEIVVSLDAGRHLVARRVPDPFGDRLVLSVLVTGPSWVVRRTRRRLRVVSAAALTAGPTVSLRPVEGAWVPGVTEERPVPPVRPRPAPPDRPRPAPRAPEPVGGSALAALDAPVPSPARPPANRNMRPGNVRPGDLLTGGPGFVPTVVQAAGAEPGGSAGADPRPAPPSALPPPAQRTGSG